MNADKIGSLSNSRLAGADIHLRLLVAAIVSMPSAADVDLQILKMLAATWSGRVH